MEQPDFRYEWTDQYGHTHYVYTKEGAQVAVASESAIVNEIIRLAKLKDRVIEILQIHEDRREVQKLMHSGNIQGAVDVIDKWKAHLSVEFGLDEWKSPEQWLEGMQMLPKVLRRRLLDEVKPVTT